MESNFDLLVLAHQSTIGQVCLGDPTRYFIRMNLCFHFQSQSSSKGSFVSDPFSLNCKQDSLSKSRESIEGWTQSASRSSMPALGHEGNDQSIEGKIIPFYYKDAEKARKSENRSNQAKHSHTLYIQMELCTGGMTLYDWLNERQSVLRNGLWGECRNTSFKLIDNVVLQIKTPCVFRRSRRLQDRCCP